MNVGLSSRERADINARFRAEEVKSLWAGDYALENADEFFAEMTQTYFCANRKTPNAPHNHGVNCANELRDHDSVTYDLIHGIFRRTADLR